VNVGQSEPSDPPVFPLPDAGGSVFCGDRVGPFAERRYQGQSPTEIPRWVSISAQISFWLAPPVEA
jgi:hypothetical protein